MRAGWVLTFVACQVEGEDPRGGRPAGEPSATAPIRFGFPIAVPAVISTLIGVDHDPVDGTGITGDATCLDYLGRTFPHCYDEHDGSDYILDGGFDAMDAGSVEILAAADGVVVETEDGHYDRCHAELTGGTSCDGHDGIANSVTVEHADGRRTLYWHMKEGSVAVAPGDEVACGEVLGLVGSSGNSSMPHLHFEVHDSDDVTIDPYAGPYSQDESLWEDQGWPDGLPGAGCTAR